MFNLINSVPGGSPATSANLSRPESLAELEEPTKVPTSSVDLQQPADNTAIPAVSSVVKNSAANVSSLDKSSQSSKSNASTELPSIFSNTVSRCKHPSLSLILKELISSTVFQEIRNLYSSIFFYSFCSLELHTKILLYVAWQTKVNVDSTTPRWTSSRRKDLVPYAPHFKHSTSWYALALNFCHLLDYFAFVFSGM